MIELSPWHHMISGKLAVFPARNPFQGLHWDKVKQVPLRKVLTGKADEPLDKERCERLLAPYKEVLASHPLYITLDKDVMRRPDCLQNWDSGVLWLEEIEVIITTLIEMSNGNLLAIDITGDFSQVKMEGTLRKFLHSWQHSETENDIPPTVASERNQATNEKLLKTISSGISPKRNKLTQATALKQYI
eukprot:TRINITY_DN2995_c0_g1_i3.p1 TRINITY_DN2995_c0_g1~~TRINITY_DN2995_c0_g1_i3.p1  ORF type:complete len:189 (-),score=30.88 TRINITY_DN2995_c0_g1_i3:55-621(-)